MSSNQPLIATNCRGHLPTARRTWSAEQVRQLRELARQGICVRIIAARLRKTESAVRNKAGMLGISIHLRSVRAAESSSEDVAQACVAHL